MERKLETSFDEGVVVAARQLQRLWSLGPAKIALLIDWGVLFLIKVILTRKDWRIAYDSDTLWGIFSSFVAMYMSCDNERMGLIFSRVSISMGVSAIIAMLFTVIILFSDLAHCTSIEQADADEVRSCRAANSAGANCDIQSQVYIQMQNGEDCPNINGGNFTATVGVQSTFLFLCMITVAVCCYNLAFGRTSIPSPRTNPRETDNIFMVFLCSTTMGALFQAIVLISLQTAPLASLPAKDDLIMLYVFILPMAYDEYEARGMPAVSALAHFRFVSYCMAFFTGIGLLVDIGSEIHTCLDVDSGIAEVCRARGDKGLVSCLRTQGLERGTGAAGECPNVLWSSPMPLIWYLSVFFSAINGLMFAARQIYVHIRSKPSEHQQ